MVKIALVLAVIAATASADDSKLAKDGVAVQAKAVLRGKDKLCCGYPLVQDYGWALRFYWISDETTYELPLPPPRPPNWPKTKPPPPAPRVPKVEIYSKEGWYFAHVLEKFARDLRLEGSGVMADGRVVNTTGGCKFGYGTCFEALDPVAYPYGRGSGTRPLIPYKSVAVDQRIIPIGEPLYIPEFDGMVLPDGSVHDGCVRADDTGGGIIRRKMDFFVVGYWNFRFLLEELANVSWVTPHIQAPRCEYLRDR